MPDGATEIRAARAACGVSAAEEKRIALSLSPSIAWPTLALAMALPTSFVVVVALGLTRTLPLWACTPILALVSYAHYSLVHESIHGNVVASPRSLGWVNIVVGWIGAVGMGAGWPVLQKTHLLHHSHTNTESDPDLMVKGTLGQLVRRWAVGLPMSLLPFFAIRFLSKDGYARLEKLFTPAEIAQSSIMSVLAVAIPTGHGLDWVALWFAPTRVGILILNIFFQWLPHYPFDRTERYHNTRISLWPGGTFALLQQNLHLMHHLWPSVPFYNYARLYRALKPVLRAEGSRIEGLMVGPYTRTVAD